MQEREAGGCSPRKETARGAQEVMVWVNWYVFFRIRFSSRIDLPLLWGFHFFSMKPLVPHKNINIK